MGVREDLLYISSQIEHFGGGGLREEETLG
jgi:hypothetical protein